MSYLKGPLKHSQEAVDQWYRHWTLDGGLDAIERMLPGDPFCFGASPTLADCCLVPQLFNARRFDLPLDHLPKILRAEKSCTGLKAFASAHPSLQPDAH